MTADVNEEGQILAQTQVKRRFHIRVLDKLGREISSEFPSKCNHTLSCLIAHPTDTDYVLESCGRCEKIRTYNIQTGQCSVVYKDYILYGINYHGPAGSILCSSAIPRKLSILKWYKENHELRSDKSVYPMAVRLMCYSELFHMLVVVMFGENEIQALKLEGEGTTLKFADPIWKLSRVVDGHAIKANAITSDKKGNIYVADGANNRILKINGLTGDVVSIMQTEEGLHDLFWSDTEPNLIVAYSDKISCYCIPELG